MSFKEQIVTTFAYIYFYRKVLFKALLVPFSIMTLFDLIFSYTESTYIEFLTYFISLAFYSIIAITTHRIFLLGPSHVPEWGIRKWTMRESIFFFYLLGMTITIIPITLFGLIPIAGAAFAIILYLFFIIRFSIIFPSIAVGDSYNLSKTWKISGHYQKNIFYAVILIPFVISVPVYMTYLLPNILVLNIILNSLVLIIAVASLSITYQYIKKDGAS